MKYLISILLSLVSLYSMTLDETVEYALEHNDALKQSSIAIERSKSIKNLKRAQKFGRVGVVASYEYYNNARTLAPLTPMSIVGSPDGAYSIPTTKNLFSVGIAYDIVLFDGFAQQNSYKISDLQYINSDIKSRLGKEELIYNVRNIYLSLLGLKEQLEAQKSYVAAQEKLYKRIQEEYNLGSKSKLELLKAHTSLEESHSQIASFNANITILKATLTNLMGGKKFDEVQSIEIKIDREALAQMSNQIEKENIFSLKKYKASELGVVISKRKQEQVDSAYYPNIDLSAYYGQNFGLNDTQNRFPATNEVLISKGDWNNEANWQIGIHLKWNIFNFGASQAKSQEAKLAYIDAKLQTRSVEQELKKNIITAQSKIKLSIANYNNANAQYKLLLETKKIEQIRYDNDALSLTDLLYTIAKKELVYAQMINAKYSYQKAIYYLDYLLEKGQKR